MAFSHHSPAVGLSYETRVSSEMDPSFVEIKVRLTFKQRFLWAYGDEYIYQRILGESNVYFPLRNDSIASCVVTYLRDEFHRWMPALCPSVCDRLSQDIVLYAQRVAVTREGGGGGGATVVTASMELLGEEEQQVGGGRVFTGGLQAENGEEDESVCWFCLEKVSPGVKISELPCSHRFHHSCMATWLEKSACCPLCLWDITNHGSTPSNLSDLEFTRNILFFCLCIFAFILCLYIPKS